MGATVPEDEPTSALAAMAYDGKTKQAILFGGMGATSILSGTWVWDGSAPVVLSQPERQVWDGRSAPTTNHTELRCRAVSQTGH
jgi:hypothetical protein